MDVLVLIDKLDDLVHNSKPVPLTDQVRATPGVARIDTLVYTEILKQPHLPPAGHRLVSPADRRSRPELDRAAAGR